VSVYVPRKNDFHTLFQRNGTRDIRLDNSEFNIEIDVSLLNGPIPQSFVAIELEIVSYIFYLDDQTFSAEYNILP
jgi:hypothetical protein